MNPITIVLILFTIKGRWEAKDACRNIDIDLFILEKLKTFYFNILGDQNVDRSTDCICRLVATESNL